jgi:3-oxoacyl-[acyl-carrier-protein] synthase I
MTIYLQELGLICALGADKTSVRDALFKTTPPTSLTSTAAYSPGRTLPLGQVVQNLPSLADAPACYQSRNNAMAWAALSQIRPAVDAAIQRYGADRVAVVLGTSTSGLPEGEAARLLFEQQKVWPKGFSYAQQELGNLAKFMADQLGLTGISYVISTACSSGAKALASSARLLNAGLADAVITGGCDVLSAFTVAGFSALESVSADVCNPMSVNRCGINLGEGAALFLLGRELGPVCLAGWGESSDAHHMSAPDPTGAGAIRAMQLALAKAKLTAKAIDYLNLHGTGTPHNDAMEAIAVHTVLGAQTLVSSTKPFSGHTLAAAGAIEAAFLWLTLVDNPKGQLPPHWWDKQADPKLQPLALVAPGQALGRAMRYAMSNSFAFGGSNASVLLGASQ